MHIRISSNLRSIVCEYIKKKLAKPLQPVPWSFLFRTDYVYCVICISFVSTLPESFFEILFSSLFVFKILHFCLLEVVFFSKFLLKISEKWLEKIDQSAWIEFFSVGNGPILSSSGVFFCICPRGNMASFLYSQILCIVTWLSQQYVEDCNLV